jgi:hypothetical protein
MNNEADRPLGEGATISNTQLAQANGAAPELPADGNVIRIDVVPGAVVELPPPFNSESGVAAKIGDGNLALKVGDVTVILEGYVAANQTAPVTVETAQGKPIDIATILAETDPNLDIQTAAGEAAGAQAADNGHFLAAFGGAPGLGGLLAVGPLDQTALSYGLIDNSIRQELTEDRIREDDTPPGDREPPSVGNSVAAVDEGALPFGSHPGSNGETASGFVTIVAPNGVASISVGGTSVDLGNPGNTPPIAGTYGEITITGWNPTTGELDYTYTLNDNFHHDPVQGPNVANGAEDFPVTVTDKQGLSDSGEIGIDIIDDVPTACADAAVTCACGDASGNVLANDTPGADGIVAITVLKDGTHVYQLDDKGVLTSNDAAGNYSYDQATGVLEIFKTSGGGSLEIDLTGAHTGEFAYSQGKATAADDFQYTVVDGDGDTSTADLKIQPDLDPPAAQDDHIFAFTADFSIANAWLLNNDQQENKISVTGTDKAQHLSLSDLSWGELVNLDPGATTGGFEYEVTSTNGKTDTGAVDVNLVSDPAFAMDQSKSSVDVVLIGDWHGNALSGGSGNDVLFGGGGKDQLLGHGGLDTLLYDSQSTFDGGSGTDRLVIGGGHDIGFDSGFVDRVHSVEVLDFRNGAADTVGAGKGEALSIDAVLDMTDGKGEIWIAAESGDSVTLGAGFSRGADITNTAAGDGVPTGTYATYAATDGVHSVTVHIDTEVAVHL